MLATDFLSLFLSFLEGATVSVVEADTVVVADGVEAVAHTAETAACFCFR